MVFVINTESILKPHSVYSTTQMFELGGFSFDDMS